MARIIIGSTNRSPVIQIVTWFFFCAAAFFLILHQTTRRLLRRRFALNDSLMIAATALCLAQTVLLSIAAAHGLGKPLSNLDSRQIAKLQKSQYAAMILLIPCLGATKLSIIHFMSNLTYPNHLPHARSLSCAVGAWMPVGIIVLIFQCKPPQTWDLINNAHCINLQAFWAFLAVGNILTDIPIVIFQSYLVWGLHMNRKRKKILYGIFATRLFIPGIAIVQLITFERSVKSSDETLDAWVPVILNEVGQSGGIITACLPHMGRLWESLESHRIQVQVPAPRHQETTTTDIPLSSISKTQDTT